MNVTKRVAGIFSLIFIVVLFSNFVSAGPAEDIDFAINSVRDALKPLLRQVVGNDLATNNDTFFAAILIFIIIFSILWVALDRVEFFSEHRWVLWLITAAVTILATRWISDEWVNTIILPYSTLGIALSAGLPFVLYFIVIDVGLKDPRFKFFRKVAWIFFAVIFIGLWISRYDQLGNPRWIYPLTALLSVIMGFADGTIQRALFTMGLQRIGHVGRQEAIVDIKERISELPKMVREDIITQSEADRMKKEYFRKLKWLMTRS